MKYTLINWIRTENWEGAMIKDKHNDTYLTNGLLKWKLEPHRKFEIVKQINESNFYQWWSKYFPYCTIEIK